MTTTTGQPLTRPRWVLAVLTALMVVGAFFLAAGPASAATGPAAENRIRASASTVQTLDRPPESVSADQRLGNTLPQAEIVVATGVAANSAGRGADNVVDGVRLRARLTGEEIAGGHSYTKHVVEQGEYPHIRTRGQFAELIEDVVANGEMRTLSNGRSAYWRDGTVVIRNPRAPDGGTAFRPNNGYSYFLDELH